MKTTCGFSKPSNCSDCPQREQKSAETRPDGEIAQPSTGCSSSSKGHFIDASPLLPTACYTPIPPAPAKALPSTRPPALQAPSAAHPATPTSTPASACAWRAYNRGLALPIARCGSAAGRRNGTSRWPYTGVRRPAPIPGPSGQASVSTRLRHLLPELRQPLNPDVAEPHQPIVRQGRNVLSENPGMRQGIAEACGKTERSGQISSAASPAQATRGPSMGYLVAPLTTRNHRVWFRPRPGGITSHIPAPILHPLAAGVGGSPSQSG